MHQPVYEEFRNFADEGPPPGQDESGRLSPIDPAPAQEQQVAPLAPRAVRPILPRPENHPAPAAHAQPAPQHQSPAAPAPPRVNPIQSRNVEIHTPNFVPPGRIYSDGAIYKTLI